MTPTARTLAELRRQGIPAQVVERWLKFSPTTSCVAGLHGVRKDLFGCIDVIALRDTWKGKRQIVGIQCCAMSGRAAHVAKVRAEPLHLAWLEAGGLIEVWAWRKTKLRRGSKAIRWTYEVTAIEAQSPAGCLTAPAGAVG